MLTISKNIYIGHHSKVLLSEPPIIARPNTFDDRQSGQQLCYGDEASLREPIKVIVGKEIGV